MMKNTVALLCLFCACASGAVADGAADMQRAQQLFKNFDANGDGGISLDEYRAGMGANMSELRLEKVFKEKDRNGDGQLNLGELLYVPMDQRTNPAPPAPEKKDESKNNRPKDSQLERLFKNFDTDRDGAISLEEYRAGMGPNMSELRLEKVFKEKDRNGDGKLTLEELAFTPADQQSPAPTAKPDDTLSKAKKKGVKAFLK